MEEWFFVILTHHMVVMMMIAKYSNKILSKILLSNYGKNLPKNICASFAFGIVRVLKLCFRGFDSLWFFTLIYLLYYDDVIFFFCIEY